VQSAEGGEYHPHLNPLPSRERSIRERELASGEKRLPRFARNDRGVEGEDSYSSISQFKTFFITSVRLSLVTRSVSTSGWRFISSAKG
jgi:hypothetical protein